MTQPILGYEPGPENVTADRGTPTSLREAVSWSFVGGADVGETTGRVLDYLSQRFTVALGLIKVIDADFKQRRGMLMFELALYTQIDPGIDFRIIKKFSQGRTKGIIAIPVLDFRFRQQRIAAPFLRFVLAQQIEFQRFGLDVLNEIF